MVYVLIDHRNDVKIFKTLHLSLVNESSNHGKLL